MGKLDDFAPAQQRVLMIRAASLVMHCYAFPDGKDDFGVTLVCMHMVKKTPKAPPKPCTKGLAWTAITAALPLPCQLSAALRLKPALKPLSSAPTGTWAGKLLCWARAHRHLRRGLPWGCGYQHGDSEHGLQVEPGVLISLS